MKNASTALIDLLANSRQFVMWEEFVFTLADGTQITYSTYDQDAPPVQATAGIQFLLDGFDGNGSMAGRSATLGGNWSVVYPGGSPIEEFTLTGSGGVYANSGSSNYLTTANGLPSADLANYEMTGNFQFIGTPPAFEQLGCGMFAFNDQDVGTGWECDLTVPDGESTLFLYIVSTPDGADIQSFGPSNTGLAVGSNYSLSVAITNERKTVSASINGTPIGNVSVGTSLPEILLCGMTLQGATANSPVMLSIEGASL